MVFVLDPGEKFIAELLDCLGAVEGQPFVHLSTAEVAGHALRLKNGFDLRVEVYLRGRRFGPCGSRRGGGARHSFAAHVVEHERKRDYQNCGSHEGILRLCE